MSNPQDDVDPRRVRIGLVIVTVVFLASLVLAFAIDDRLGRGIMAAIALSAVLRAVLLVRSIRKDGGRR